MEKHERACTGKKKFTHHKHARQAVKNGKVYHDDTAAVRVYLCRHCKHFHIGSPPPRSSRLRSMRHKEHKVIPDD